MDNLDELLTKFVVWLQDEVTDNRVDGDEKPRIWVLQALGFDKELTQENLRNFIDRTKLHTEFKKRYKERNIAKKKAGTAIELELAALYSFAKCLVERHKTRADYYRDDLSNKGVRIPTALGISSITLEEIKTEQDA